MTTPHDRDGIGRQWVLAGRRSRSWR